MNENMIIKTIPKWPVADENEELLLKQVLDSENWWKNPGIYVKQFEQEFADYHECKGGVAVSNGTVALEIALKALNIGEGDEVIVPDFTFYSTVSAVLAVNAVPVVVDVLEDTFCIDPAQILKAITNKTKAIIPVHIAGHIADMDSICDIATTYGLYVIEDCSHAPGAVWKNKKAGSFGILSTFSFQNAKLLTAGEGGIILSNDEKLLKTILLLSNCGRAEGDTTYQHILIGTNARLSEFQGGILHAQFGRYENQIVKRENTYKYLSRKLVEIPGIRLQKVDCRMSVHPHYMLMFYYNAEEFSGKSRDQFVRYLKHMGIPANRAYEAIHKLPVFRTLNNRRWRVLYTEDEKSVNTEKISDNVVCLSHNILLGDNQLIDEIISIIRNYK